jgi:hypothetical protein
MSLRSFDACSTRLKREFLASILGGLFSATRAIRGLKPEKLVRFSLATVIDEKLRLKWAISWCKYSPPRRRGRPTLYAPELIEEVAGLEREVGWPLRQAGLRLFARGDVYRCPAGEKLTYRYTNEEDGKILRRYWTTACPLCQVKSQCTTGGERRIS